MKGTTLDGCPIINRHQTWKEKPHDSLRKQPSCSSLDSRLRNIFHPFGLPAAGKNRARVHCCSSSTKADCLKKRENICLAERNAPKERLHPFASDSTKNETGQIQAASQRKSRGCLRGTGLPSLPFATSPTFTRLWYGSAFACNGSSVLGLNHFSR